MNRRENIREIIEPENLKVKKRIPPIVPIYRRWFNPMVPIYRRWFNLIVPINRRWFNPIVPIYWRWFEKKIFFSTSFKFSPRLFLIQGVRI